jgi:hypothetical protein
VVKVPVTPSAEIARRRVAVNWAELTVMAGQMLEPLQVQWIGGVG